MAVSVETLVDAAVQTGLIDAESGRRALAECSRGSGDPLEVATHVCRLPLATFYRALAEVRAMPFVDMERVSPPRELIETVPPVLLHRKLILPISLNDEAVTVATSDPEDQQTIQTVRCLLGRKVKLALAEPKALEAVILQVLGEELRSLTVLTPQAQDDFVKLFDEIMWEAFLRRASDIHIEPQAEKASIRLRVDGNLREFRSALGMETARGLLSRIKVLAGLDISERREAQDGGFTYQLPLTEKESIDVRVATLPTRFGERATVRLFGLETKDLTLDKLGLSSRALRTFRKRIRLPSGMILLVGPTGSGKTTSLYAALREINTRTRNVLTIEDPVEYTIEGVSQVQIDNVGKLTFPKTLRSLLRHDPDVVMVGEIRDHETADTALKAAMTGHLLFSTLHSNTACGAITRLADIGCERHLIGSTVTAVIAQRLVKRLCTRCRRARAVTHRDLEFFGSDMGPLVPVEVFDSVGCAACHGTGFRGRVAIFETFWIDHELGRQISNGVPEDVILRIAIGKGKGGSAGLTPLRMDGLDKILAGITTVESVAAATAQTEGLLDTCPSYSMSP